MKRKTNHSILISLCLLMMLCFSTNAAAQQLLEKRVTLDLNRVSVSEMFDEINKQTKIDFICNAEQAKSLPRVSVQERNATVKSVLDKVLGKIDCRYEVKGNVVVVSKRGISGTRTIHGVVTDKYGDPLMGAHIKVNETSVAAITDENGDYIVIIPNKAKTFTISYVGMKKLTTKIPTGKDYQQLDVKLLDDNSIDEVVVTGYQNVKKSQVAGSMSTVKAEDIMLAGTQSIEDMLQGQVTGMNVMINSGDPGASAKIRIRGTSSILGNRAPLWVLDGVILSDDDIGEVNTTDLNGDDAAYLVGNAIAGINPNDIDKITVLKDASATAVYGVQAANGVIVVTTKQGHSGAPKISYSGSVKLNQRMSYGDLSRMNATERLQLSADIIEDNAYYRQTPVSYGYEGLYMDYLARKLTYDEFNSGVQNLADMNTDWYDILFRNSVTTSHALNMSGGNEGTRYYASFGYDDTESTAIKNNSKRFTAMAKLNSWLIDDKLYVGFQVNASTRNSLGFHSSVNPNTYAYETSRAIPCYNSDGSLFEYDTYYSTYSNYGNKLYYNILNEMNETGEKAKVNQITALLNLQWKIWGGLQYKLQASYQNNNTTKTGWATDNSYYVSQKRTYSKDFINNYVPASGNKTTAEIIDASPIPVGGIYSKNNSQMETYTLQNTLEYNHVFNKKHVMNLMAVSEIKQVNTDGLSSNYYGWQPERGQTFNPVLTSGYVSAFQSGSLNPSPIPVLTDGTANTVSWIFTGSYSYKDKLILNSNMRMDGSNQFGSNPKYRFLPIWSVSGKYTLSKENFMRNQDIISYLALRASYGIQGNVDGGSSPDLVIELNPQNSITGMNEATIKYLPNPDLRWEKTKSYNFGLDLSLLDDRVSFVFDLYSKKGTDMIMNKQITQTNGFERMKINAGKVNNSGIEIGGKFIPYKDKDWDVTVGVNYSYNKNKLIDANESLVTAAEKLSGSAMVVGEALGTLFSYDFAGLNHDTGYPVFRDINGNTTFTNAAGETYPNYNLYQEEASIVKSGVTTAPHQGGIQLSVGWKGLRLSSNFTYQLGAVGRLPQIYGNGSSGTFAFNPMKNVTKEYSNRWRKPGDEANTDIPVLYNSRVFNNLFDRDYVTGKSTISSTELYNYSTARVASTDYLKLQSLTLNYVIPRQFVNKYGFTQCTVGLQATNLFTWADSRWEGSDPIANYATTPLSRAYSLNLNITF